MPNAEKDDYRQHVEREVYYKLSQSPLWLGVVWAIGTALLTHWMEHRRNAGGGAASLWTVEFAIRLAVFLLCAPGFVWLFRRIARSHLPNDKG